MYYTNIENDTINNFAYRKVVHTTSNLQLVLMSLLPNQSIGLEKHPDTTQFFRFEKGYGLVQVDDRSFAVSDGDCVVVNPGSYHNVTNVDPTRDLKFYTIYSPPEHENGLVEITKTI